MKDTWERTQHGRGWSRKLLTIEPSSYETNWILKCNGQFVASFKTAGSCKRVGDCILREFHRTDETLHSGQNPSGQATAHGQG